MLPSDATLQALGKSLDASRETMERHRTTLEESNRLLKALLEAFQKGGAPGR